MVSDRVKESVLTMLVTMVWNVRGEGEKNHRTYLHRELSSEQGLT